MSTGQRGSYSARSQCFPSPREASPSRNAWKTVAPPSYSAVPATDSSPAVRDNHGNFSAKPLPPPPGTTATNWNPGAARHIPWLGLSALLLVILCSIACALLLRLSDGQRTSDWRFSPTVYLAILSTAANIALAFALARGAAVAWWARAVHGSSIRDLHRSWQYGTSLWTALGGAPRGHRVALAVLATAAALANGPLLQRASIVVSRDLAATVPLVARMAPQIPGGFTGLKTGRVPQPSVMTSEFASVMAEYLTRAPMTGSFDGDCPGTCTMTVQAAALASRNCTTTSVPLDYRASPDASSYPGHAPIGGQWPAFTVMIRWTGDLDTNEEMLRVNVSRAVTDNCTGVFETTSCLLHSATAAYDVQLSNGTVTFAAPPAHPRIVRLANNTDMNGPNLTLGGLYLAALDSFFANVTLGYTGVYEYQFQDLNTFAMGYVDTISSYECQRTWRDPTDDVMAALNEVAFRVSLQEGNVNTTEHEIDAGLSMEQAVDAKQVLSATVFQTIYAPLWVAVLLMNLGVMATFFTFLGWWKLGRSLTLDPMETARAFNAPIFSGEPSNTDLKTLIKRTGNRIVRYEQVGPGDSREMRWVDTRAASAKSSPQSKSLMSERR